MFHQGHDEATPSQVNAIGLDVGRSLRQEVTSMCLLLVHIWGFGWYSGELIGTLWRHAAFAHNWRGGGCGSSTNQVAIAPVGFVYSLSQAQHIESYSARCSFLFPFVVSPLV